MHIYLGLELCVDKSRGSIPYPTEVGREKYQPSYLDKSVARL